MYYFNARWYDPYLNRWIQPDDIVPDVSDPLAWDRYQFVRSNPLRYNDPSGHNWNDVGDFFVGFTLELGRSLAWSSQHAQIVLAVNSGESDASLIGRIAADVVVIAVGTGEVSAGIGIGTAGTAVSCVATLCTAAVVAVGVGTAAVAVGAATTAVGASALGQNSGMLYSKRTTHGQIRADQGRPIGSSWNDAQKAGPSSIYLATETGNYVVSGKNGRISIFIVDRNGNLRLNTAFRNDASNTANRLTLGKWRHLSEIEYNDWLDLLNSTLRGR